MKKIILASLFLLLSFNLSYAGIITVDQFITPDNVTIAHLESFRSSVVNAINGNIDYNNILTDGVKEVNMNNDANVRYYFDDAFNDYVKTGLIPPTTSGTLTSTTTAGRAYIEGYLVLKDATAHTYTASKYTYVDLSSNGTYTYQETAIGAAEPAVTASSVRLARVLTDGTQITAVRDDRDTSINTSTDENHYRTGFELVRLNDTQMYVNSGVVFHGSNRIAKVSVMSLDLATATDWINDVSGRTASTMGFVVIDSSGNIELTTTAPTKADTSGNTVGKLRYSLNGSTYERVLGWFYMNANQNMEVHNIGNFKDGNVANIVNRTSVDTKAYATQNVYQGIGGMTLDVYCSGSPISIIVEGCGVAASGITGAAFNISEDSISKDSTELPYGWIGAGGYNEQFQYMYQYTPSQGQHKFNLNYKPISSGSSVDFKTRRIFFREE